MIDTKTFYDYMLKKELDFFTGVPDSLLQNICACIKENSPADHNIIAANEGNAVGLACGYHVATGRFGVVYMQNSGLGNTVNPLLSLADEDVYRIPMLLIIGWRGEPGVKDEPQHITQGRLTLPLLEVMGIEYQILGEDFETQLNDCCSYMKKTGKPIALIVKKGSFSNYKIGKANEQFQLKREEALELIIENIEKDSFIVSTTGKTSREIFEIRERRGEGHDRDFLTVGSMGHTSSIAFGMSIGTEKNVYCIDGDGSFIMHMGGLGIAAQNAQNNFKYILINNGAHESVGGQPTVGFDINIKKILQAVGFDSVKEVSDADQIEEVIRGMKGKDALIISVSQGSRDELGRPTVSPEKNKQDMMTLLTEGE